VCPICAQVFVETEKKEEMEEIVEIATEQHKDTENIELTEIKRTAKSKEQRVLRTECKHLFHEKCLKDWMKIKPQCPSCRADIVNLF